MDLKELLLTTSRCSQQWSACLWDPTTGNALQSYKNGGIVAPNCLVLIGEDYLLTADETKPVTHLWPLNSQEPIKKLSTILPEKVTAMAVCPKCCYLAMGIGNKFYLWHLPSGKLFTVQRRNFQPISKIQFSNDGVFVIIGGRDGMLIVYDMISLLSFNKNYFSQTDIGQVDPVYLKHDHTMSILDIHVGIFGFNSRIATVSADQTCKLYELSTGEMLLSLVFYEELSAVVFENSGWNLFVGTNSGNIQQFSVKGATNSRRDVAMDEQIVFKGHQKRVTCLALGVLSNILASGSDDNCVKLWAISSRQVLKTIKHNEGVTNVRFIMEFENFFVQNLKATSIVKVLDRHLNESEEWVHSVIHDRDIESSDDEGGASSSVDSSIAQLRDENNRLRVINKQLYDAGLNLTKKYHSFA